MGRIVYDHTLLAEPNLLIPGKKPVGPVVVDNTNSLSAGIIHYGISTAAGFIDLLTGTKSTISQFSPRITSEGYGHYSSYVGDNRISQPLTITSGVVSVVAHIRPVTPTTYGRIVADDGVYDSDGSQAFHFLTTSSNKIVFRAKFGATWKGSLSAGPSYTSGSDCVVGGRYNGAQTNIWKDGSKDAETTLYSGAMNTVDAIYTGGINNGNQFFGHIYARLVFNIVKSDVEMQELTKDPYQILTAA